MQRARRDGARSPRDLRSSLSAAGIALQDCIICYEMLVASILHHVYFPYDEFNGMRCVGLPPFCAAACSSLCAHAYEPRCPSRRTVGTSRHVTPLLHGTCRADQPHRMTVLNNAGTVEQRYPPALWAVPREQRGGFEELTLQLKKVGPKGQLCRIYRGYSTHEAYSTWRTYGRTEPSYDEI